MNKEESWKDYCKSGWNYHERPSMFDLFSAGWDANEKLNKEVAGFVENGEQTKTTEGEK